MRGMYPSGLKISDFKPSTNKPFSNGEFLVYREFEELSKEQDIFCIYSYRLEHHIRKNQGEIDYILIFELGIIVLEVKSSKLKRDSSGNFFCFNRNKSSWEQMQNPFKQAEENSFSLINILKDTFKVLRKRPLVTWGCVFPENDNLIMGHDVPHWRYVNHNEFLNDLYPYLLELLENERKKKNISYDRLSPLDIKTISEVLVGSEFEGNLQDLDISQGLKHLMKFTTIQYGILMDLDENERIFFYGAAGTGKTFLAIQEFRRLTKNGLNVLLLTINKHLLGWMLSILNEDKLDYSGKVMTYDSVAANEEFEKQKFDALILDEVQDIMFDYRLGNLDNILKGGLANGRWRFFGDPFRQSLKKIPIDLKSALKENNPSISSFVSYKLRMNVRNTKRIVQGLRNAADLSDTDFIYNDYTGEKITLIIYQEEELAEKVNAQILKLLHENTPPHRISLVLSVEVFNRIRSKLNFNYHRMHDEKAFIELKGITVGDEEEFKGLENDIVIYVLPDTDEENNIQKIYIGMSRARLRLVILSSIKKIADYIKIIKIEE
jgi:hypothetical protein